MLVPWFVVPLIPLSIVPNRVEPQFNAAIDPTPLSNEVAVAGFGFDI